MDPILIGAIAFAVLFIALVVSCLKASREKTAPDDLAAKPVNVIELPPVGEPYDHAAVESDDYTPPESALDKPCPAIQEAQKRLADLPPVISVTQPKQPRKCDVARSEIAEAAAHAAASELRSNHKREKVAERWGYASVDSMRKALNRWGFKLNGQPKEVPSDPV
jgi:hypothetical protein